MADSTTLKPDEKGKKEEKQAKQTEKPVAKKKVTPDVLTGDLDVYKQYCAAERGAELCESYVYSNNENKRLSAVVKKTQTESTLNTVKAVLLVIVSLMGLVLVGYLVYWVVIQLQGIDLAALFEGMMPTTTP